MTIYKFSKRDIILPDDHMVYAGFAYIADNKIIRSEMTANVETLRLFLEAQTIRRCEFLDHPGIRVGDTIYSEYYRR